MKKKSLIAVFVLFVALLLLCYGILEKNKSKTNAIAKLKDLGISKFFTLDSLEFLLSTTRPTIIIFFNSECDICRNELKEIKANISRFRPMIIILVSSENISTIKRIAIDYDLVNHSNFFFVKINSGDVFNKFGSNSVPQIFIYGKNGRLVKKFKGETTVGAILKYCR